MEPAIETVNNLWDREYKTDSKDSSPAIVPVEPLEVKPLNGLAMLRNKIRVIPVSDTKSKPKDEFMSFVISDIIELEERQTALE